MTIYKDVEVEVGVPEADETCAVLERLVQFGQKTVVCDADPLSEMYDLHLIVRDAQIQLKAWHNA